MRNLCLVVFHVFASDQEVFSAVRKAETLVCANEYAQHRNLAKIIRDVV